MDPLQSIRVCDVMDTTVPVIPPSMKVRELCDRIARGDPQLTPRQATPIVDEYGNLCGIITRGDLVRALKGNPEGNSTVCEAGSRKVIVAYQDELLRDAVDRMLEHGIGRLMVVSRENPRKFVGYLGRSRVLAARLIKLKEEVERAQGAVNTSSRESDPMP